MVIKRLREGVFILLFWFIMWAFIAKIINSSIVPSPISVYGVLVSLLSKHSTYVAISGSLNRVLISLIIGILSGLFMGILAGMSPLVERLVKPLEMLVKSTPIVCFIIILWLYFDKTKVPSICGVLLCCPIVYTNVIQGYARVDLELINMSRVYKVPLMRRVFKLYLPSVLPYLFAGILTSIGICWKATISAEVISILDGSIGMHIYNGKVLLEFDHVFAWTIIIIFCSVLIEYFTKSLMEKVKFYKRCEVI